MTVPKKPVVRYRAIQIFDHEEFHDRTGYVPGPTFGGIVAFYWNPGSRQNVTMGMVGLDKWTPRSVTAHWWIRHPRCIEGLWYEVRNYVYGHGRRKIIGITPADNKRAMRIILGRLGFREIARINDGWDDGVDVVISEHVITDTFARALPRRPKLVGRISNHG